MTTDPGTPAPAPPRRAPFDPLPSWAGTSTTLVHGARRPDRNAGAVVPPIYQTATFHYPAEFSESAASGAVPLYTRLENPTQEVAAELVRRLEGGEGARVFGSGMGAITTALLALLAPGDEVVAGEDLYGGTLDLLRGLLPRYGVSVRWVPSGGAAEPSSFLGPATRVVLLESPTNPTLRVHDLARWAGAAHGAGALLVVDSTFATPVNQRPLALGADLVLHSGTKYLGGHADLLAGLAVGPSALLGRIDTVHAVVGSVLDPFAAFLLARGLRTLGLRIERQNANGERVARELARHPKVVRVHYPGLGSAEEAAIVRRQMAGRGGMVSLSIRGGRAAAHRFLHRLRLVHVASSLGGVESLASLPVETSHRALGPSELAARGIDDGLVRLSLGIEDGDDLVRDLTEALDGV